MEARRTAAEIVDAVATAAHRLFVASGPAAVSLREIAAAAGINLGLIHRYVGSKDDVVALVLERHSAAARAALQDVIGLAAVLDMLAEAPRACSSGRLFAGILLDDIDALQLKREFPVADVVTEAVASEAPARDPTVTAALLQSLVLGWEIFSPYLLGAAGADGSLDERSVLREALQALIDGPTGAAAATRSKTGDDGVEARARPRAAKRRRSSGPPRDPPTPPRETTTAAAVVRSFVRSGATGFLGRPGGPQRWRCAP